MTRQSSDGGMLFPPRTLSGGFGFVFCVCSVSFFEEGNEESEMNVRLLGQGEGGGRSRKRGVNQSRVEEMTWRRRAGERNAPTITTNNKKKQRPT